MTANVLCGQKIIPCKVGIICKDSITCKSAILCKSGIICKADILCKGSITCKPAILCKSPVFCSMKIIPCNAQITPPICKVGLVGCPTIDPVPFEGFIDVLKECGVRDIKELAKKQNTQRVKMVISKLSPANRKTLTLMLKRIVKE